MAQPYFIWKDIDSRTYGIWVSRYPDIIRPQERVNHLTIAGRAGQLTVTEGENIYEPITLQMRIQLTSTNRNNWSTLINWLSGESELVLGVRPNKAYAARLVNEVDFTRYSNDIAEATLEFEAEPFLRQYPQEDAIEVDITGDNYRLTNYTDSVAYPLIVITGTGEAAITFNSAETLTIADISGDAIIDCGALMVTSAMGENILDSTTGDFPHLLTGLNLIEWEGDITSIVIQPNWRWLG